MTELIHLAISLVKPQFRLPHDHGWHGISHWSRVWLNARELCVEYDVDQTVPCLFSFFHDSQRFDEGVDYGHGFRAAEWVESLRRQDKLNLSERNFELLIQAIELHSSGETEADPIVQICWDADRLDLGRVGIMPDPQYLCTDHAKKKSTIRRAWNRSTFKAQHQ